MFECTFTGGWRFYSRPLIEDVSPVFILFWAGWVLSVNFMTMRVVGALFLKETMAVAAVDAERVAMESLKKKQKYAVCLHQIFEAADSSGDGAIYVKGFKKMLDAKTLRMCGRSVAAPNTPRRGPHRIIELITRLID